MPELSPRYNPAEVEERLYTHWESQGLFHAVPDSSKHPYTIVIPPPNVTGILHMGHALNNTIQDIIIRFKRMQGFNALWVPGTDHAGIATQNVVEKQLAKEKLKRQDIGREQFLQRVWKWKEQYGNTIIRQLKRLGSSCDWERTRFTMDEGLSEAVADVFVRLYEQGLIYRGNYIINWCPRCQTALSDEEAPHKDTHGKLYYIKYPLAGQGAGDGGRGKDSPHAPRPTPHVPDFIVVATTRPETMLGDTAIAVNPKDKRYQTLVGKTAILPLVNRPLKIIADDAIDPEFGTGAVKVTPAHDPVDFGLGKKYKLEFMNVMTDDGHITNVPKAYEGLDRFEARNKVMEDLEQQGLVEKITDHQHSVGHCYRCDTVVEPRLSLQWFVKMKPLAEPAIEAVKNGDIVFTPARWTKVYLNWMENIQDWCISRQIWWGHRLPVYYCQTCVRQGAVHSPPSTVHSKKTVDRGPWTVDGVIVSKTRPERCPSCGNAELAQDEDVLDTWFSSWLWPFSTLGWPKQTQDLGYFYPTATLVTAPEIIFFWVARMIMAGYFCMGKLPFRKVYIHGTVRDLTGKKMSKSLGNIIDPLEIIAQFGADALRYTLVTSTAVGTDVFISSEKFIVGRNFANKLWNVTRFVLSQTQDSSPKTQDQPRVSGLESQVLSVLDRWIISRLQRTITDTTKALEEFNLNEAARVIYDFLWHDYCDWYVELAKLRGSDPQTLRILREALSASLRLLHPIMPFVTDELWQSVRPKPQAPRPKTASSLPRVSSLESRVPSIMTAPWPNADKTFIDEEAEAQFALFQAVVTAIRNTKAELNMPHDRNTPVVLLISKDEGTRRFLSEHKNWLQSLAHVSAVDVREDFRRQHDTFVEIVDGVEVVIPLGGLIDVQKETKRLQQKVNELNGYIERTTARLQDKRFAEKAPSEVIEQSRKQLRQTQDTLKKLSDYLAIFQSM